MNQQSHTGHPLVDNYLRDLERLLHDLDPLERAEVIEGVREHVADSLAGTDRSDADVRAALARVGPGADVAEEAYAGRPVREPPARPRPVVSRNWLPVTVAALEALTLLVALLVESISPVVGSGTSSVTTAGGETITSTETSFDGSIAESLMFGMGIIPFVLVLAVLVAITTVWTTREKATLICLPFAVVVLFAVLPSLGNALFGVPGVYAAGWTAVALTVVGGGALLTVLVRRATRRARALG